MEIETNNPAQESDSLPEARKCHRLIEIIFQQQMHPQHQLHLLDPPLSH